MRGHVNDKSAVLTAKQHEVMLLVARRLSTKEIARELGIAPNSVDHRIDAVRKKLGCSTRAEAATIWLNEFYTGNEHPGVPLPVTPDPKNTPTEAMPEEAMQLNDSGVFIERSPWSAQASSWQVPEVRPRDLGAIARLAIMVGLAIALVILVTQGLEMSRGISRMLS